MKGCCVQHITRTAEIVNSSWLPQEIMIIFNVGVEDQYCVVYSSMSGCKINIALFSLAGLEGTGSHLDHVDGGYSFCSVIRDHPN